MIYTGTFLQQRQIPRCEWTCSLPGRFQQPVLGNTYMLTESCTTRPSLSSSLHSTTLQSHLEETTISMNSSSFICFYFYIKWYYHLFYTAVVVVAVVVNVCLFTGGDFLCILLQIWQIHIIKFIYSYQTE